MSSSLHPQIEHLFRHESGKITAVLSRILGIQRLDEVQDIVQDTLLQAMNSWSIKGMPAHPPAWLMQVAKNKAIDLLRRQKKFNQISPEYAYLLQSGETPGPSVEELFLDHEIADSQLRMIFACCHPSIPVESAVALTLKTLCGLSVAEIARAFLTSEETIAKRIYRAKEKISREAISLSVPVGPALPARLDAVLKCLYLLFNEGYNSGHPEQLIREDLCMEAMRLCHLLTHQPHTSYPRTKALLSLMCFQGSRLKSRLDDKGQIILLKFQDRGNWYRPLILKGFEYLDAAAEPFEESAYHLEAAIASLHAAAPSFAQTDWKTIHRLYTLLAGLQPGPLVLMNRAIACLYAFGWEAAMKETEGIRGLEQHYLYPATLGEIFSAKGEMERAKNYYEQALALTSSIAEQQLLQQKISLCR